MAFSKNSADRQSGEDSLTVGTTAWNIADGYTKIKILRILIQLDLDEEIALFGRKDDMDATPLDFIPHRRIEGFLKYIFHLNQLISNCEFAIYERINKKLIEDLKGRIANVEKVADGISETFFNDVTKESEVRINEQHFKKCFYILRDVKTRLNFPINNEGLIFRASDEMDIDEIMRSVEENE